MRHRIIAAAAGLALVLGTGLAAQPAAAASAQHRCTFGLSHTNTANWIDYRITQTCGKSLRAIGNWGGHLHYGTYRKTPPGGVKHSVACDETTCQSHPDGALNWGGYQRKDTGAITCQISCAARAAAHCTAQPAPHCGHGSPGAALMARRVVPGPCNQGTVQTGIGLGSGGYAQARWHPDSDSSTTDGCAALWVWVKGQNGRTATSGKVYSDDIWTKASVPGGAQLSVAKVWVFINGCNIYKVLYSPNGTTGWKIASCPAAPHRAELALAA